MLLIWLPSKNFFILCDNWKTLFFTKVCRYSESFSNHHAAVFLERSISKEVYVLRYLHNNSTMLVPKFKNQVYCTCKISIINLKFLILFQIFLYKWFLINSKPLWKMLLLKLKTSLEDAFTNMCQNRIFIARFLFFTNRNSFWKVRTKLQK